jgi:hypothetical protein
MPLLERLGLGIFKFKRKPWFTCDKTTDYSQKLSKKNKPSKLVIPNSGLSIETLEIW